MSIANFYNVAARRDFARQFQFRLLDFGPIGFGAIDDLTYVETASLPGRSINNVTVPYMGLTFNTPGTVTYPGAAGWNVTFRCDSNYRIREALEAATFGYFDEATSSGSYGMPDTGVTLTMALLGKEIGENGFARTVRVYTLYGVWIQALADAAYDVKDTGTVQTIQCTLAYQFWRAANQQNAVPQDRAWRSDFADMRFGAVKPAIDG
jgi:hypothetical protein